MVNGLLCRAWLNETRHDPPVIQSHSRPIGVENTNNACIHTFRAKISHDERLGKTFGLIVHRAQADRIHMTPVGLRLRMFERITVDLGSGGEKVTGLVNPGKVKRVESAERTGFQVSQPADWDSRKGRQD